MMSKFNIGDIVIDKYNRGAGAATVVFVEPNGNAHVRYGDLIPFEFVINENCLERYEPKLPYLPKELKIDDIKIIVNKPAVIAIRGTHKGVAKCNPIDTFALNTGIDIAIKRLKESENGLNKFVPKFGQKYHFIDFSTSVVLSHKYNPSLDTFDKVNFYLGNMFKTKKEAEENLDKMYKRFNTMIRLIGNYLKENERE